jgi:hypothetical protein
MNRASGLEAPTLAAGASFDGVEVPVPTAYHYEI